MFEARSAQLSPCPPADSGHRAVLSLPNEPLGFPLTRSVACASEMGLEATALCPRAGRLSVASVQDPGTQTLGHKPVPAATRNQSL